MILANSVLVVLFIFAWCPFTSCMMNDNKNVDYTYPMAIAHGFGLNVLLACFCAMVGTVVFGVHFIMTGGFL